MRLEEPSCACQLVYFGCAVETVAVRMIRPNAASSRQHRGFLSGDAGTRHEKEPVKRRGSPQQKYSESKLTHVALAWRGMDAARQKPWRIAVDSSLVQFLMANLVLPPRGHRLQLSRTCP